MLPAGLESLPSGTRDSGLAAYFASLLDPTLTWDDVDCGSAPRKRSTGLVA